MTLNELLKKANGYRDPDPVTPVSDDLELSNASELASSLRKMASAGERDDKLDKLAAAVAIYMNRHPEVKVGSA